MEWLEKVSSVVFVAADILSTIMFLLLVLSSILIWVFTYIPGDQPEKALSKLNEILADFILKISKVSKK